MNPLKAKSLLPEVSQELNLDQQLVNDTSEFFFDYLHKLLANLDDIHILVPHLGTFHARKKLLDATRKKLVKQIPAKPPTTFQRYAGYKEKVKKLSDIDRLLQMLDKEYAAQKDFRITKNARKHQALVEKQEEDYPGDME